MTAFLGSATLPPGTRGFIEGVHSPEVQPKVIPEMLDHSDHVCDEGIMELGPQIVHPALIVATGASCI